MSWKTLIFIPQWTIFCLHKVTSPLFCNFSRWALAFISEQERTPSIELSCHILSELTEDFKTTTDEPWWGGRLASYFVHGHHPFSSSTQSSLDDQNIFILKIVVELVNQEHVWASHYQGNDSLTDSRRYRMLIWYLMSQIMSSSNDILPQVREDVSGQWMSACGKHV